MISYPNTEVRLFRLAREPVLPVPPLHVLHEMHLFFAITAQKLEDAMRKKARPDQVMPTPGQVVTSHYTKTAHYGTHHGTSYTGHRLLLVLLALLVLLLIVLIY